ncbi:MAG: AMP-binding protein [Magnetococcus sp. DMHC-8]
MKLWSLLVSLFLRVVLRIAVRGGEHLDGVGQGCLVIANHPGRIRQWVLLAWLATRQAGRQRLLCCVHPGAVWPAWLNPLLPGILLRVADPLDQRGEQALTAVAAQLVQHLQSGGRAVVWPMALPDSAVSAARAHLKPYGWSILAARQAGVPILAACIEQTGRRVDLTLLPPCQYPGAETPASRHHRQLAGQWAQDRLGEAALRHHQGRWTLWRMLCRALRQYGRHRLVLTDATGQSATYGQLVTRALILGGVLARRHPPGERIGLLLPTSLAATTTFFALQAMGGIPALLNFTAGPAPVCSACRTARIQTVYTSRLFVHKAGLTPLTNALQEAGQAVLFLEDVRAALRPWQLLAGWWRAWWPERGCQGRKTGVQPGDPAVILFTSGSEGVPKGVLLSHDNLVANGVQVRTRIDVHPDDLLLNVLPVFHAFGLTVGTLWPLWVGIRCHALPSPLDYHQIPEVAYTLRVTLLAGTDTFLSGYARAADPGDFVWLRHVVAGAEPLREETSRLWMERFGVRILEGYGTTEASPVLAFNTPLACRFGSVGRLVPGVEHHLEPVPGLADGALLAVRGPNIMLGYLLPDSDGCCHPPSSRHGAGWYSTGDVVRVDEDGFVHILGRARRFAKLAGEMISLAAVEQLAARTWPGHRHAAVAIGVDRHDAGGRKGEQLVLVTEAPHPDRRALLAQLRASGLGETHLPGRLIGVEQLPLLGSGKIDLAAVQILAANTIQSEGGASRHFPVFSVDEGEAFLP